MTGDEELRHRKRAARKAAAATLGRLSPGAFDAQGRSTALHLRELPTWGEARTVCVFLALPTELSSDYCCETVLAAGKTLLLPRVEGNSLDFHACRDLLGPWRSGPFGIREPRDDSPAVDPVAAPGPLIVLVPGMAFDGRGGRLGRGKGYYDRFLRSLRSARQDVLAVGLCMEAQLVEEVPSGSEDERVDGILTGLRYLDCRIG